MSASIIVLNNWNFWDEIGLEKFFSLLSRKVIEILKVDENVVIGVSHIDNNYVQDMLSIRGSEKLCEIDENNQYMVKIKMPLIVNLLKIVKYKANKENITFSEQAVYDRDGNICQYEHDYVLDSDGNEVPCKPHKYRCSIDDRTIDHVIPTSRGGKNAFTNCVCSCFHCNVIKKKNMTPEEAGLKLLRKPYAPTPKRGDVILMTFNYNPKKKSHRALFELLGVNTNYN